jgi:hypothetical protein
MTPAAGQRRFPPNRDIYRRETSPIGAVRPTLGYASTIRAGDTQRAPVSLEATVRAP